MLRSLPLVLPFALAMGSPAARAQTWLVNEIRTGAGEVELVNAGGAPADPSGLCLWGKEIFGNPCSTLGTGPLLHLEIPAGTPVVAPGGTLTLESGSASCGIPLTRGLSWQARSELIVILNRDPADWSQQILDMLSVGDTDTVFQVQNVHNPGGAHWTGGPVMRPGTGYCDVVYRTRDAAGLPRDTNTAADWQVGPYQLHTPCAPNPIGEPNPMTLGPGYAPSGNCAPGHQFSNTSTERPTLTLATCTFAPRLGSSLQFAVRTGMTSAPPITCLLIGNGLATPAPVPFAPCAANAVTYLDPATASTVCHFALPWDAHFAADLPALAIPNASGLVGRRFVVQGFVLDPQAGACPLRTTNGLRIEIER